MQHTMKKIAILALALLFVPFAATAQKYKLLWKENFRGSRIDTEKWSKIKRGTPD